MLRTEPYFPVRQFTNDRLEVSCAQIQLPHQTQPRLAPAVHDSRLPLRLLLIVTQTLNVAPAKEPLAAISVLNCSHILCEELIQIVHHLKGTGFQRGSSRLLS
jgi:hypothetical protein